MNEASNTAYGWSLGIQQALARTAEFVPRLLAFLLILVAGFFLARLLGNLINSLLEKVGFDRVIERGGLKRALARSGQDASNIVGMLVFYTLMLFVLQLAFSVFGPNPISALITQAIAFIPNIIVAAIIIVVAAAIAQGVRDIIAGAMGGLNYGMAVATAAYVGIITLGVFAALNQLNIAPEIVNGLFYAALAIVVGVTVVAVGGGGIAPMRAKWERALTRMDTEMPRMVSEMSVPREMPKRSGEGYVS